MNFSMDCPKLKRILSRHGMICAPFAPWHLQMFDVIDASGGLGSVLADYETYLTVQSSFGPAFSVLQVDGEVATVGRVWRGSPMAGGWRGIRPAWYYCAPKAGVVRKSIASYFG